MRITVKTGAMLLLAAVIALSGGCVQDARFDYSELNLRLKKAAPAYCFDESALFYADSVYYAYYSFVQEQDTLLTLKEDETGRLDRITLTADAPFTAEENDFKRFALLLAELFIPDAEIARLREETGLDNAVSVQQKTLQTFTQGFYHAALVGTERSTTFVLEYG